MEIEVTQIRPESYHAYALVRPAFLVESALECRPIDGGLGGLSLRPMPVDSPYTKYGQDEDPPDWAKQYDLSRWGIFMATIEGDPVGGAAVAPPSPGMVIAPAGREDLAVLWDIRVSASARRQGVGTALFQRCAAWAEARGFKVLAIETQNVNVPACHFYSRQGCQLAELRRHAYVAYPQFAHEVMLIWHLGL